MYLTDDSNLPFCFYPNSMFLAKMLKVKFKLPYYILTSQKRFFIPFKKFERKRLTTKGSILKLFIFSYQDHLDLIKPCEALVAYGQSNSVVFKYVLSDLNQFRQFNL